MMFNKLSSSERTTRFWRFDGSEEMNDGPVALVRELGALAWLHKKMLLACLLVGFLAAGFYAYSLPKTYVSMATLLLEPRQSAVPGQDTGPQQNLDLNRADSELQIISSERLLSAVFESLDLQSSPELGPQPPSTISDLIRGITSAVGLTHAAPREDQLAGGNSKENARRAAFSNFSKHLSVRRVGQSFVIEIQYSSIDPAIPARVANAAVSGYIMQAVSFKAEAVRARSEALQGRLDALAAQVVAASDAMKLGELPAIPTPDADARIIGAALPPLAPSGPRAMLITVLGGIVGFLAGACLVGLNFARDRKVVSVDELTRQSGVPCLGIIPGLKDGHPTPMADQHLDYATSIRDLRTSVEIACAGSRAERGIVIALVGWNEGQVVSTISMALSRLIRGGSRNVTLFQSARWAESSDGEEGALPSHSLVDAALSDLQPGLFSFHTVEGISVLPIRSANAGANLLADFRHPRVSRLLNAARERGDVLLDLPAMQASKDALALATHADAVLFVAALGEISVAQVTSAMQQMRRARVKVIGTVVTGAGS
jgi:capsular polysaccharide biosynthesis protein